MKAVIVKEQGAAATVVDNLEVPEPSDDQVLVKSLYSAMNPVYISRV
jgi:NADPH:quinone reductase-like Zn-dependent oxidoreductase